MSRPGLSRPAPPAAAGSLAVVGFLVLVELVSGLLQGMMPPLLPRIGAELHLGARDLSWVTTAQLLSSAVCVPLFARLGDMYGHRRLLRITAVTLAVGSILVAWAPSYAVLLLGRVLQGVLAALLPLEIGLVRDRLAPARARGAVALLVGALTFGASAGLLAAGGLSEAISGVRGILWVPAVAAVFCVGVVFFLVPESVTRAPGRADWSGAVLLSAGLAALLLGVAKGSDWGWGDARVLGLFALAVMACVLWVRVELRVEEPLVDLRLTVRRELLPVYVAAFMVGIATFGSQTAASLFLASPPTQLGYGFGYDTVDIAWILLPSGLCALLAAGVAGKLAKTVPTRAVLASGGVLMCAGYLLLTAAHDHPWQFIVANCLIGFATGLCLSAMPALVLDASPAERTGIATGIHNTAKTIGGSVAGAVFATVLTALTLPGTDVPTENAYRTVWACCAGVALLVTASAFTVRSARTTPRPAAQPQPATAD
ncbi:MFS transporter [Streptomyces sp. NPDC056568]|uniref:MFS transporter n=1 Tax=Streptomyces sp. NPDC056568 TaxID=3345866 RepID=UPI0036AC6C2C